LRKNVKYSIKYSYLLVLLTFFHHVVATGTGSGIPGSGLPSFGFK